MAAGQRGNSTVNESREERRLAFLVARLVAWATVPLYAAGMGAAAWLARQSGQTSSSEDVLLVIGLAAFAIVGSVLVGRRPGHPISWIMVAISLTASIFPAAESYAAYVMTTRGQPDALATLGVWANEVYWVPLLVLVMVYMPLLFPDGHLPSPRWWPVPWIAGLATAGLATLSAFRVTLIGQNVAYQIANPIGIAGLPSAQDSLLARVLFIGLLLGQIGAVAAVVVRFRRSRAVERQQLKWFVSAVALSPLLVFELLSPELGTALFALVLIGVPTAVGVAILRYRLYDIDLIIRRTLQYSLLTGLLALVYLGSVVLLQALFERLVGQSSPLVIVLSTLLMAAAFAPLRRRVQAVIDRRFYRQKFDAGQVLAQFAATARDETDLDRLATELTRVVSESMRPAGLSLWLRGW